MTIREYLVKKIAVNKVCDKLISERVIDKVISHQFEEVFIATSIHNTIEISGFGKFSFNEKKAHKIMEKYETQKENYTKQLNNATSEQEVRNLGMKIKTTEDNIAHLKPKLREL